MSTEKLASGRSAASHEEGPASPVLAPSSASPSPSFSTSARFSGVSPSSHCL